MAVQAKADLSLLRANARARAPDGVRAGEWLARRFPATLSDGARLITASDFERAARPLLPPAVSAGRIAAAFGQLSGGAASAPVSVVCERLFWGERRDVGALLRLIRLNADARAPAGLEGADWLAKRLTAFGGNVTQSEFGDAAHPLVVGVPAESIGDLFHYLGGGSTTVPAVTVQAKLFGRSAPVYLDSRRNAHAQLATVFKERAGETLVHNLARTEAWVAREHHEEAQRARQLLEALENDAQNMDRALRSLWAARHPPVQPPAWWPSARGDASTVNGHARAAGTAAAMARVITVEPPSRRLDRGEYVPERTAPRANFAAAPPLKTLVRRQTGPARPPPLRVATHRARPTVATMAACRPSRMEAAITAVGL
jgi:hypothetical protein